MPTMNEIKREEYEDANGDLWNIFTLKGRWGNVKAIGRKDDGDWSMPFFSTRKRAITEIELITEG